MRGSGLPSDITFLAPRAHLQATITNDQMQPSQYPRSYGLVIIVQAADGSFYAVQVSLPSAGS